MPSPTGCFASIDRIAATPEAGLVRLGKCCLLPVPHGAGSDRGLVVYCYLYLHRNSKIYWIEGVVETSLSIVVKPFKMVMLREIEASQPSKSRYPRAHARGTC